MIQHVALNYLYQK